MKSALSAFAVGFLGIIATLTLAQVAVQNAVPADMRGQIVAVLLLALNIIGMGFGPFVVGFFADQGADGANSLAFSIALVTSVAGVLACILLYFGRRPYANLAAPVNPKDN